MGFYWWISLMICLVCLNSSSSAPNVTNTWNQKKQRPNSKMSKDFLDPKNLFKEFSRDDKLLRQHLNISNELNEIPDDDVEPKIINGRPAEDAEFPWMVALHFSNRFVCSAFLISPRLVMTAAHCVEYENGVEPASAFYGIISNTDRNGPEIRIEFEHVSSHPEYGTGGSEGDIAILRTTEPVDLTNDRIKVVCLPSAGRDFDLDYAQAMGWGITSNAATDAPDKLHTTQMSVQPHALCRVFYAFFLIAITDRHVCASSERPTGVCFGDSGGPLVFQDPQAGVPVAIGVASFVTILGCGRPLVPSVYTAVASYTQWITDTVGTEGLCFT